MFDMLGKVVKNLFSEPATRNYPFEKRELGDKIKGYISGIDPEACIYCGICDRKCPSSAIRVDRKNRSWEINTYKCILCNECIESCPKKCIKMEKEHPAASSEKINITCQGKIPEPKNDLKGIKTGNVQNGKDVVNA